jgi:hypothetical protein
MKLKIFSKIDNAEVQTEPFDHVVIDNLLPQDFYKEVSEELDRANLDNHCEKGDYGTKGRFGVDITDYSAWKNSGCKSSTTIHQNNYNLISQKLPNVHVFVNFLLENEKSFYSAIASKFPTERIKDDYFFHLHLNKDSLGYKIPAHVDGNNIFTILFYTPQTDVNKMFGLDLYGEGGSTPVLVDRLHEERHKGPTENLQLVKHVDFLPNRMLIFAPSYGGVRPATWHGVNQLSHELTGTRNSFQMFFYPNENTQGHWRN